MPSRYAHPDEKGLKSSLRKHYGLHTEEKEPEVIPTASKPCPRCKKENSAFAHFCMQCGMVLDIKTAMALENKIEKADSVQERLN